MAPLQEALAGNREVLEQAACLLRQLSDVDADPDWSRSTLKRELQFLVSHTVHHFALIRALLGGSGIDPGESFGLAPSTAAARRLEASGARDLAARR